MGRTAIVKDRGLREEWECNGSREKREQLKGDETRK
jgi:hypothetical protein